MKRYLFIVVGFFLLQFSFAQSFGDIRTTGSGSANWTDDIWEYYDGGWLHKVNPPSGTINGAIDITRDVTLNSMTVSIAGTLTVSSTLRVQSSGRLNINPSGDAVISGSLFTDGSSNLTVISNSSGTGSLRYSGSPSGTMQCYITEHNWHLVGPPTDGLQAADAFYTGYMQTWADGNPGSWTVQEGNPSISRGRGAAYYFFHNFTASMAGNLNGAAKTIDGLGNAGGSDDGWHLLANPFPCGVDLTSCSFSGSLGSERYVYNGSSYVQRTNLAASQGFFVRVTASGNYSFPTSAKTTGNSNIQKSSDTDYIKLHLADADGISNDEIIVRFNENASEQFDPELDGLKLIGNPNAGEFMAVLDDDLYGAISSIPFPNQLASVPVYFKKGSASEYTISVIELDLQNIEVTLYDVENELEINLSETPNYTFSVNDSIAERFILQFKNASSVSDLEANSEINIRHTQNYIIVEQERPQHGELIVYDISGKMILNETLNENSIQRVSFANHPNGVYIVQLIFDQELYSQKIVK